MRAATTADLGESLELTDENVEVVLGRDQTLPYGRCNFSSSVPLRQYWTCIVDDETAS